MRKKNQKSIKESLQEFEKLSSNFDWAMSDFEEVYNRTIKAIAESPYMFNYYHWVTNFKDMRIIHISGLKKMLGHDEDTFTLQKSFGIIHPNFRPFVLEYAKNAYEMLCDKKYRLLSSKAHYSIQFPVLRADGEYILVQMNVSIIMVDKAGNPLANYNRFEVLGKYFDGPILIQPRVFFRTNIDLSDKAQEAEAELSERVRDFLLKQLGFTDAEKKVLLCLSEGKPLTEIAKALTKPEALTDISVETVKIHTKHILTKAKNHLSPLFKSARDVAEYLKSMNII